MVNIKMTCQVTQNGICSDKKIEVQVSDDIWRDYRNGIRRDDLNNWAHNMFFPSAKSVRVINMVKI